MILEKLWFYWLVFFGIILIRYFLIAGGAYWFFYFSGGKSYVKQGLRLKPLVWKSIRQDVQLSVLSAAIFALCGASIVSAYNSEITLLYASIGEYGLWYLGVSFIAVLMLQDAYFYFIHRAFHHPFLFKWFHQGHHRSGDPTPWTSFAFDPLEAIIQALFLLGIVFIIPLHFLTLVSILVIMSVWTVWNHLGLELFPKSFARHWLGKWFIGSTHHSIHHRKYMVHYGLYFTLWDRLFGTQDPNYEKEFSCSLSNK